MTYPAVARVRRAVRLAMVRHARAEAPRECCGLLLARGKTIEIAVRMTNVSSRPRTRFQIDAAEHIALRRMARRFSPAFEIVGAYHSHPAGPASPSLRDIAEWHYPDWLFVVVGAAGRSVRAYRIAGRSPRLVRVRWA
jgi:proteasome lid subunit RPN8/RPN11